jgi:hypothetical protein
LIEKRLKQVIIAAIDKSDVERSALEGLRRI